MKRPSAGGLRLEGRKNEKGNFENGVKTRAFVAMVLRFVSLLFQFKQTRKTMDGESIESDKKAICESKRNFICFNGRL